MDIRLIFRNQIDDFKWNSLIGNSKNGVVFAYTWFLDFMCENWCAIVCNDYDVVVPLPFKKKFFLKYVYHPFFIQQLGVFFKNEITEEEYQNVFKFLSKKFLHININLNQVNKSEPVNYKISKKITQELNLNRTYEEIKSGYSSSIFKNLMKTEKAKLKCVEKNCIESLISLQRKDKKLINNVIQESVFDKLELLLNYAYKEKITKSYLVLNNNEDVVAAGFFIISNNRAIKFTARTEDGRKFGAGYLIHDKFIRDFSGQNIILDFVGSNVPNVAFFNHYFGSYDVEYLNITKTGINF